MNIKKTSSLALLPVLFGFFVMGFCDIVGISSDYMKSAFGLSETMTGFIPSMVFIWFFFLSIPIGNQMDTWGRKRTVSISMTITILGMFLPLLHYSLITCITAYILLGIGNVILQVSLNPLLDNVISNKKMLASSLTVGQVIKAVSSLIGPEVILLATAQFGEEHWYYCFPMLGIVTIVSALWLTCTPIKHEANVGTKKNKTLRSTLMLLKNKNLRILFWGVFFIVGLDVSMNFISSKLMATRFNWNPEEVKWAPQVYFFSRTIGALLGAILLRYVNAQKYFKYNVQACVLALLTLMICSTMPTVNLICLGAIGFFASSIFSVIYGAALQLLPQEANHISGLMITAVAGGAIVTPLLGFAIDTAGIVGGLSVIVCCALYLTYCAFQMSTAKNQ